MSQCPEEGEVYATKFLRNRFPYASSWMWVTLKKDHNHTMLKDAIIEAELLKAIGEHPHVPKQCALCCKQLTTETKPSEDHGVSCASSKTGAASLAGGIVERAATLALRCFDDTAERKPCLDFLPCLQRLIPGNAAKEFGDILSTKCGRNVVVDVTFSSMTDLTLEQLEEKKSNEYRRNREFDANHFVPFVLTSSGAWGERMVEYMYELNDAFKQENRGAGLQCKFAFRKARETISLGICKANWVYLKAMREGSPSSNLAINKQEIEILNEEK
jgi:hypothetical protein